MPLVSDCAVTLTRGISITSWSSMRPSNSYESHPPSQPERCLMLKNAVRFGDVETVEMPVVTACQGRAVLREHGVADEIVSGGKSGNPAPHRTSWGSNSSTYRMDWGGPTLFGVLVVHMRLGAVAVLGIVMHQRRLR